VCDRPRASENRAEGTSELLESRDVRLLADATPDGENELSARHVDVVAGGRLDELQTCHACARGRGREVAHRRRRPAFRRLEHVSAQDRKSTRLNSSHVAISYAVFCLKKKNKSR